MTEMQYQIHNWYHFVWLSGDNICEQHVHNLDVCNWVKNDHPVTANGMGGCLLRYVGDYRGTGQIFDQHFVEFTYKDGTKMFSQCRHMAGCWNNVSEAAHGTKGESNPSGSISAAEKWRFRGEGQQSLCAGTHRSDRGHPQGREVQRRLVRRDQQHDLGAGSHGDLLGSRVVTWDEALKEGTSTFPKVLAWDAPAPVQKNAEGNYPIAVPGVTDPYKV